MTNRRGTSPRLGMPTLPTHAPARPLRLSRPHCYTGWRRTGTLYSLTSNRIHTGDLGPAVSSTSS
eukprot:5681542-Lingulodinium_polyedra.AAC.1